MAWERRGGKAYFYRSVRRGGKVGKEYLGGGAAGQAAAAADQARRAARLAERAAFEREQAGFAAAEALTGACGAGCEVLLEAVLLASGFRRRNRQRWRAWREGRGVLGAAGRAAGGP
jgi:hypothetical protein